MWCQEPSRMRQFIGAWIKTCMCTFYLHKFCFHGNIHLYLYFKVDETKNLEKELCGNRVQRFTGRVRKWGFVWKSNKQLNCWEPGTTNASSKTKTAINYSTGTEWTSYRGEDIRGERCILHGKVCRNMWYGARLLTMQSVQQNENDLESMPRSPKAVLKKAGTSQIKHMCVT